ncbi:MAG: AAA family ATPase [Chakrabartia godavariana]
MNDFRTISPNPALVHLVTGGTGAGKTHYSMALAEKLRAMRFSIDDWMTRLFWSDAPQPPSFEWVMDRIGRCEAQIRAEVQALAALGIASVLDLGFTKADHREAFAAFADEIGAGVTLHWVDRPAELRWERVQQRNRERGATYAMDVDRAMFDFMESEWEAPSAEELARLNGQIISE